MKNGGRRTQREQTRTQASDESLRDRKAEKALEEAKKPICPTPKKGVGGTRDEDAKYQQGDHQYHQPKQGPDAGASRVTGHEHLAHEESTGATGGVGAQKKQILWRVRWCHCTVPYQVDKGPGPSRHIVFRRSSLEPRLGMDLARGSTPVTPVHAAVPPRPINVTSKKKDESS